jgi:hypothetical protein
MRSGQRPPPEVSMTRKQLVLWTLLVDFSLLTAWAVYQHGLIGIFELAFSSWGSALLFVDLSIALGLVLVWMFGDSRERGLSFLPYAALTLAFGSVGPLAYLIRRERQTVAATPRLARAPQEA